MAEVKSDRLNLHHITADMMFGIWYYFYEKENSINNDCESYCYHNAFLGARW